MEVEVEVEVDVVWDLPRAPQETQKLYWRRKRNAKENYEKELPSEEPKMAPLNPRATRGLASKTDTSFATLLASILLVRMGIHI